MANGVLMMLMLLVKIAANAVMELLPLTKY